MLDLIPLPLVPREIAAQTGSSVSYRRLYMMAVDGAFPAHQVRARWVVSRADLPAVADALGLTTLTAPADRAAA